MSQDTKPNLPIGYWLKRADSLLTEQINRAQAENGVTRTEWQVLNLLAEMEPATRAKLFESMQAFVNEPDLGEIIAGLTSRGWVEQGTPAGTEEATFYLTEEGRRQHSRIRATQVEIRQSAMRGISQEDYLTTIGVLQRMVGNLEQDADADEQPQP